MKGKHTAATRNQISQSLIGRPKSLEMRAALSASKLTERGTAAWELLYAQRLKELTVHRDVMELIAKGQAEQE